MGARFEIAAVPDLVVGRQVAAFRQKCLAGDLSMRCEEGEGSEEDEERGDVVRWSVMWGKHARVAEANLNLRTRLTSTSATLSPTLLLHFPI